jgi:FkbM family methyltransferase
MLASIKSALKSNSWALSLYRKLYRFKCNARIGLGGGVSFQEGDNYSWIYPYVDPERARGSFIVEIGSRDALDAISLVRQYSPSECFVFEPTRVGLLECFKNLGKSTVSSKVTVLPFAVIGSNDVDHGLKLVEFKEYTAGNIGASSLFEWHTDFHADTDPDKGLERRESVEKTYKVPAIAADDLPFLFEKRVFLLAMDVEGAECEVLKGAQSLLKTVDYVCVESGFNQPRRGVARDAAVLLCDFMGHNNFDLISVDGFCGSLPKDDGLMKQFNLLFRNRALS